MALAQDLHQSVEELTSYIHNAKQQVEAGSVADLSVMEDTIKILCDSVQHMDGTTAQRLKPEMAALIRSLDELAAALNNFMGKNNAIIAAHDAQNGN